MTTSRVPELLGYSCFTALSRRNSAPIGRGGGKGKGEEGEEWNKRARSGRCGVSKRGVLGDVRC